MYKYSHLSHVTSWHRRTFCDIWALSWAQTWIYTYLRAEMNEFNWMRCDTIYFALAWQTLVKLNWLYKFWFHLAFCHSALNIGSHTYARVFTLHLFSVSFRWKCLCVCGVDNSNSNSNTNDDDEDDDSVKIFCKRDQANQRTNEQTIMHTPWMSWCWRDWW